MRSSSQGRSIIIAALLVLPAACSQGPFEGTFADLAAHDLGTLTPNDRALLDRAGSTNPEVYPASGDDAPPLATVEDYVQLALTDNPRIAAASQRVKRLNERIAQVTSLEDPRVTLAPIGSMAQTAAGEVSVMSSVSQRIPYPGRLETRGLIVQQDVAIARQRLERVRLTVIADTRRAYWSLYYAVRAIEITNQNRDLLAQLREIVQAKYRTGTATQESILRLSVELHNLDNELLALDQRRTTAAGMLNTIINRPVQSPVVDPPAIELSAIDQHLTDLLALAQQHNPDIRAVRERLTQFRRRRELARLARHPDLIVGLAYNIVQDHGLSMAANGEDQWWLSVGANIPIWTQRLDAGQREATRGILETAGALAGEQNRIAFQVNDAFARVEAQQEQVAVLRDVIVPEALQAVEVSLSGYRAGHVSFDALIDNWRKLLSVQLMTQSLLSQLERSIAELEEALGADVARTDSTGPSAPVVSDSENKP